MDMKEIKALVQQNRETNTLEFKKSTSLLKSAIETICAFLNGKGGVVIIGVKNDGSFVGQDVTDNTQREIANELRKLEPSAQIEVSYVSLSEQKQLIILQATSGAYAPYIYDGRPFYREQSETVKMPQQRYDQLVAQRAQLNYSWERFPAKGYSIRDLDEVLITELIHKAVEVKRLPAIVLRESLESVLHSLDLYADGQLNNAAVVLFGKRFTADFMQCTLKLARFKGLDRHEFLDTDLIKNNLFRLLDAGLLFVRRHLPVAAKIVPGKMERVETPLIPENAIREALLNALAHRDYSNSSGSVGLAIYDNRMEIFNDGGLPPGLTLEAIKAGFSKPRNPTIATVLYRFGLIEKWGRGIKEIIGSCIEAGDPEPKFVDQSIQFSVTFDFPSTLKPPAIESVQLSSRFTKRQQAIIDILTTAQDSLKTKDILKRLKEKITDRTLRRELVKLKERGVLETEGSSYTVVWYLVKKREE